MDGANGSPVLPGGLYRDGKPQRRFRFKPVDGELELLLQENLDGSDNKNYSEQLRDLLLFSLAELGDGAVDNENLEALSLGDRDYLLVRLAVSLDDNPVWVTAPCGRCEAPMDISFRYAELPIKNAGEGYPETTVVTSLGELRVRVPTVGDHLAIAGLDDDDTAFRTLLQRLVSPVDGTAGVDVDSFGDADIALLENTVERLSPEVSQQLAVCCPECGRGNRVNLDITEIMCAGGDSILAQVHQLAAVYHWSEADILRLPRRRRKKYLELVDRARGWQSRDQLRGVG